MRRSTAFYLAGILLGSSAYMAAAQTLSNPDLSLVGDFRVVGRLQESADSTGERELSFEFEELELAFNAYLNPYMRADVFIGIHGTGPDVDVEEAVMTVLRGLPASLQLSVGQYLLDFGKLNTQHPHQWSWMDRPLMHRSMLGDEGLQALGARLTTLIPIGESALGLSASAFSGSAFEGHEHGAENEDEEAAPEIMGSGRVSLFRQISDTWSAELGVSYLGGNYDPVEPLSVNMGAIDGKLRWRPDSYRAFAWVFEVMQSDREVEPDSLATSIPSVDAWGAFTSAELQWRKRWSAGAFFDWTQDANLQDVETTAVGGFFDFMPVEETARIGLVYRRETSDGYAFDNDTITLQFLWGMGPHRVHTF
ncbi:MAG TPA: hypothetical protein VFU38_06850 [Candidatus Krumholzibacteria bacterium]|nr:hypothetical protein [Candidatus Krumholzibacteria bacterium]